MTPPNHVRPLVGTERAQQEPTTGDDCDSATGADPLTSAAERKRFAGLQAHAALGGFLVRMTAEQDRAVFLASRWGLVRELDTLDELAGWLRRVGVKA